MEFNPQNQNVTFFAPDGISLIQIPIAAVNAWYDESVSITMNYGAQLGLSILMLLTLVILTPSKKMRRPSAALQITALVISVIRWVLEYLYMRAPYNHLYEYFSGDFSQVNRGLATSSVIANTLSGVLVILVEIMLMLQAWSMVTFWPNSIKYALSVTSLLITLVTIASRLAVTVVQNKSILSYEPAFYFVWGMKWSLVMNALSIFWFCAIFNAKLVFHLVSNRGILPSRTLLTPMEILIMTNGLLMVFPAIFAGLEWGRFTNFEAGSLATTSVLIILPLGTLAAQRIAGAKSEAAIGSSSNSKRTGSVFHSSTFGSPFKNTASNTSSAGSTFNPKISILSQMEAGMSNSQPGRDPVDLELSRIDRCCEDSDPRSFSWNAPGRDKTRFI